MYHSPLLPLSILVFEGERRKAMFFKRAQTEDLIVDSLEIADRFGSSLSDFCRHMQCGTITSFVEVGTADKEDPACLSLRFGNRLERVVLEQILFIPDHIQRRSEAWDQSADRIP